MPITTIDISHHDWAAEAVSLFHDIIEGRAAPGTTLTFDPGALILRESTGGESGGNELCARALACMRENIATPLSVESLAMRLEMAKATLERAFANDCGTSVAHR